MATVSVVVPVYKTEKYLYRCVDSILNQSLDEIDIILVDDGSPDGCPRMCDILANKYERIRVIHKTNGGLSSCRNAGIDASVGKYISFIDSDDFIEKNMLKRLYDLAEANDADIVMNQYAEVTDEDELPNVTSGKEIVYKGKELEEAFLKLKIDSVCVGLYKKKSIGNHRFIVGKTSEDIPFNFKLFKSVETFVFVPERRYYYFYNTESISNGCLDKNMLNYIHFRKEIVDYYKATNEVELEHIAEALYARAVMGLLTRMALFGTSKDIDERKCKRQFIEAFKEYKKKYFAEKTIPLSRKILAVAVVWFYPVIKVIGAVKR